MKSNLIDLFADTPVSVYDKTKTTYAGRAAPKTLPAPYNTTQVIGPPLSKFIDTQTDMLGTFLPGMMHLTASGRLFVLMSAPATGVANQIALYNFNLSTGAFTYVGKIAFAVSALTIAMKGFKVDDTNTSNIRLFLGYTATVAITGGLLVINKVALSNFVPIGFPTFYVAQVNDVAGVYSFQLPNEVGGATTMTTVAGITLPSASSNPAVNTKIYVHNGISATHQMNIFDYSTGPQIASLGTSTVTAANTTGAATTFTMTGNTLAVGDMVIITSNAPTGYANSASNAAQTVYYVVAGNFVAGSTFSLSATSGGAILAATGTSTTTTFVRAFGQTTNNFVAKTANLPSLGAGTLLLTNSENHFIPSSGANAGQDCVFMATTTNFIQGRLSELYSTQTGTLTSGLNTVTGLTSTAGLNIGQTIFGTGIPALATIASITGPTSITMSVNATASGAQSLNFGANLWPSMLSVNVTGTGIDYVLPVPTFAAYMDTIDRVAYPVNGPVTLTKPFTSSVIETSFGSTGNTYMEAQNHVTDPVQLAAITNFENQSGWVLYSSAATIGQRGIIAFDLRSDSKYDYSYIVSPVVSTPGLQTLVNIGTIRQMADLTGSVRFFYRTSANITDSVFSAATGGWTEISAFTTLNIALNNYTQFKCAFNVTPTSGSSTITVPAQISAVRFATMLLAEISDYWDFSYNDSSSAIPTRIGFNLRTAYASGTVPKLYFRAYDVAGNLLTTADTVTNAGNFQYSSDGGLTWNPLGTIPNVAGTRIRYTHTTPPGVDERVSLREY